MFEPSFGSRGLRTFWIRIARLLLLLALPGGTLLAAGAPPVARQPIASAASDLPPTAPVDVVAIATDGQIALSWDANTERDLLGYNVYRSTTLPVDTGGPPLNGDQPLSINAQLDLGLDNGTQYFYVVEAIDAEGNAAAARPVSAMPQAAGDPINYRINFQDTQTSPPPAGYLRDFGEPYGPRALLYQGSGLSYGWVTPGTNTPLDLKGNGRNRNKDVPSANEPDLRLATFMHMQADDIAAPFTGIKAEGAWEIQIPNGSYLVTVSVGDAKLLDSTHRVNIEGQPAIVGFVPSADNKYAQATRTVSVTDGRLTLDAIGGTNTKINYVTIVTEGAQNRPYLTIVTPTNNATGVARNVFISAEVRLPTAGAGIDERTLNSSNVRLIRVSDGVQVPANVNTSGGADVIVLQPTIRLDPNTQYRFEVTAGLRDLSGAAFIPWTSFFRTGTLGGPSQSGIAFAPLPLSVTSGYRYTTLTIGPDGKLYASTFTGEILRYPINADGSLGTAQTITSLRTYTGVNEPRVVVGMVFDPAATADNPILWVSHGPSLLTGAPDWSGKISRLSGTNLQTVTDYVINLPRSVKDHLSNSLVFGPDGALYMPQGSMSAMGAPDNAWGLRAEHLLSAAVLRIDPSRIGSPPLNVKTEEGGTYNPFASNAAVTIYATGVRNAYDLLWHSNGELYAPTNGSAGGGTTPSTPNPLPASCANRIDGPYTGPQVVGVTTVVEAQPDFLFRIQRGGYYGHPNPTRCEWVLNGGNPGTTGASATIDEYPVGTQPDRNYRGFAFNFGIHYSPNGVIEYQNNAFNGALRGRLLVTRYSGGDDIIKLTPSATTKDITEYEEGITGFTGFNGPVDLVENPLTGCLYVAEHDAERITLLRPQTPTGATCQAQSAGQPDIVVNPSRIVTNDVAGGAAGPEQTITIRNLGPGTLTIPSNGITLAGADASQFQITSKPSTQVSLATDDSVLVKVRFNPASAGPKSALLRIQSNDPDTPTAEVTLRGLGTLGTGGSNEPSLQWILDTYQIPVNVGDPDPATNSLPASALLGEEVSIQRFQKSGTGPVTIEPLAVFGPADDSGTAARLGYYTAGDPATKQQLFSVANEFAQALNPEISGGASFDPGADAFGFYSAWPFFNEREVYGEDRFNTWEPTTDNRHKVRVYPLKSAAGATVANAYVVAIEEATSGYDYQDLVVIVRNVRPAGSTLPTRGWMPMTMK